MSGAFHAYDIRGIYNKDFNKDTVYKVGFFLPRLLGVDKVLVGRDVRTSSDEIHEYLLRGIADAGADVYDIGISTTPMVYFATASRNFGASVQITASHNPKEYNGLKISRENALPVGYDDGLDAIKGWIDNNEPISPVLEKGVVRTLDVKSDYLEFLHKYRKDYSNLKIAIDLSNGMAALLIKDILGNEPHYLYDELDGTFPNHEANPLVPENIIDLQRVVREQKCDIGMIFDGDGDRVMFVDENAKFISPDLMIALIGDYYLDGTRKDVKVLQDIRSSKSVAEYLEPKGAEVYTWKVGRAFAARKLREIDGMWGGELAGHYYFKEFFYSDSGLMASLIILDVISDLKRKGITLSQFIASISHYYNSGEINFRIEDKAGAMERVKEYFTSKETPTAFYDFDGYRVEFKDWWFNIRPSNTEPYLRFICEANTPELLEEKVRQAREIIKV